jgi:hypothetical protein
MRLRVVLFAAIVLCIVPMVALPAHADSQIVVSGGGGATQTFACPASGPCLFGSIAQGVFTFSVNIGTKDGFPPSITLDSLNSASTVPADLQIAYSANNLTVAAASFSSHFASNLIGAATTGMFRVFYNASNALGGMTTLLSSQTLTGEGALSDNVSGLFTFGSLYSLTEVFNLHDTVANSTQQLTGNFMVSEPGMLTLIGVGLVGLAIALRRGLGTAASQV